MKKLVLALFSLICFHLFLSGQISDVSFTSSDTSLNNAFIWAKKQALFYKGSSEDPVGPWYEAALPGRYAFCMRDASHQCIGAEILGLSGENKNMFTKFAANISESKKWCSYWEINKYNDPAPADYRNDNDFWYNLNANFDVVYAIWRLYNWTGDITYVTDPVFIDFFQKSLNEYVHLWKLEADSLLSRPKLLNVDISLLKRFRRGFALPSYAEGVPDIAMSTDLISAIYQGHISYSKLLQFHGKTSESTIFLQKAGRYIEILDSLWWDSSENRFNTWFTYDGRYGKGEGEAYFLWFDVLKDNFKIEATINNMISKTWNVENTSYFPYLLYQNGYWENAYKYLLFCSDPGTKRREYPEVSFGVIDGIVEGLMGITPDANTRTISTLFRATGQRTAVLENLPVLNTRISLSHFEGNRSVMCNKGKEPVKWKAGFTGIYKSATVGKKHVQVKLGKEKNGKEISYIEVLLNPGQEIEIVVR